MKAKKIISFHRN